MNEEYESIYLLGDLHGKWNVILNSIDRYGCENGYIIQVGDFGVGFAASHREEEELFPISEALLDNGLELLVIRGNHDDPELFDGRSPLPGITYLEDYTVRNLNGKNFLFVGGAVSLDRVHRIPYIDYWFDELVRGQPVEQWKPDQETIDVVVTHTAPQVAPPELRITSPIVQAHAKEDSGLIKAIMNENEKMDILYDQVMSLGNPSHWYYGHFHESHTTYVGETKFVMLDINEMAML